MFCLIWVLTLLLLGVVILAPVPSFVKIGVGLSSSVRFRAGWASVAGELPVEWDQVNRVLVADIGVLYPVDDAAGRILILERNVSGWDISTEISMEARTVCAEPGDLDGDGKHEIVFPVSEANALGFHIYEWDGVVGSDNYGTTFSSVNGLYNGTDNNNKNLRHERFEIDDIDGDGQQELISVVRDGSKGMIVSSLAAGDDIVHNSGGSFETWSKELHTDYNDFGGGSPYHALPVDLNGDGQREILGHQWNSFNFHTIAVTGADTYDTSSTTSMGKFYKAASNDQHSLNGGSRADVDGDGNEEAYFVTYGAGFGYSTKSLLKSLLYFDFIV